MNPQTNKATIKFNVKPFEIKFSSNYLLQKSLFKINMVKYLLVAFWLSSGMVLIAESAKKIPFSPKNLILGSYSADPQNDETFDRLKKAGFNYVHTYRSNVPEKCAKFLELAHKYGIKVMFHLRAKNNFKHDGDKWLSATMKNVERFKDCPALGMWYMWDEPKTKMLPHVAKLRQEIAKVSGLPTALVIHWREKWENTRGYSDIWMVDCYPVRGENFPNAPLQYYTTFVSGAAKCKQPGTPFIPVIQLAILPVSQIKLENLKTNQNCVIRI